jgi:ribosomal protein RSM22 (predicted rRNA methylase)
MLDRYLRDLEQLAWRVAREQWGEVTRRRAELVEEVQDLSCLYNDPHRRGSPQGSGLARLVFFMLADLPKVIAPLRELQAGSQLALDGGQPLRCLDLGAGFGAQTLGLIGLAHRPLLVDAVDRDAEALEVLARLVAGTGRPGIELRIRSRHLRAGCLAPPGEGRYDLILVGNLLNELDPTLHLPLTRSLLDSLAPRGHLVLIEPALRQTTRALHLLRDGLLEPGAATVYAPCTRQGPCPALDDPRDWCHERRTWALPPVLRELSLATGLRRRDLKWSYLTLNRHGARLPDRWSYRVVSGPIKSKGKLEVFLCGAPGRLRACRLKRHRSRSNEAFAQLDRGCLVRLDPDPSAARPRITAETTVERWDPGGDGS